MNHKKAHVHAPFNFNSEDKFRGSSTEYLEYYTQLLPHH